MPGFYIGLQAGEALGTALDEALVTADFAFVDPGPGGEAPLRFPLNIKLIRSPIIAVALVRAPLISVRRCTP